MRPLVIQAFTAASCIGRGLEQTLGALIGERSGLEPCRFETVTLDTHVGEVIGVDDRTLPAELRRFDCRNNRLAELGLRQDGFDEAVESAAQRFGRRRVGVFMGTSTSGILQTELAYRRRDPVSGALPPDFDYGATHNSFSVADYLRRRLELEGPAVVVSCACASSAKVFATARRMMQADLIDAALVGGVDSLCLTTLYGFHSLQLCSPAPCRPFDAARDGISIGEAAAFALARTDVPTERPRTMCCSSESASRTTPTICPRLIRRGTARRRAMQLALSDARTRAGRHRLHQFARHGHAEQRSLREPGGERCVRHRRLRAVRPRARPAIRSAPPARWRR